ncbi:MAG: two pore domain potassium channel family protein [Cellulosilyticum sp.]|nr:two pore domain potassium channel family protein [Cellulosilyticum sp.]
MTALKQRSKSKWLVAACILIYIFLFVPFEKWLNIQGTLLNICTALRIIILFISLIIGANMSLSGIIGLLLLMGSFIVIYSSFYFDASILLHYHLEMGYKQKITYYILQFFKRNIIVMMIGIMILVVLFGVGKSFEWTGRLLEEDRYADRNILYRSLKKLEDKIITLFPIIGYIIVMITVIYSYAGIYAAYNNMYYEKYNYFCNQKNLVETRYANSKKEELFELEDGSYFYAVRAIYQETDENQYEIKPEVVIVNRMNTDKAIEGILLLKSGFSMNDTNTFRFGTALLTDYFYFSAITYLTIGYGDIYPVADAMKYTVVTEGIISHLLTIIFVPILMTLLQQLYVKRGKNKKVSNK